jgi:Leucine-rich repeat (LRR) protein
MKINESSLKKIFKGKDSKSVKAVYFDFENINKINLENVLLERLEFLSLKGNNMKDFSFVRSLHNLWYLDISGNPVIKY